MNLYQIIGFMILAIILGQIFNLGPSIEQLAGGIADVPLFKDKGSNPALFDLVVRLAYLIAIVGIIRMIVGRKREDEDQT